MLGIFKTEINQIAEQLLSLSKWKIGIVSAAVAAGFGWEDFGFTNPENPNTGILILYSVGWLCCYIDVLIYRRYERTHLLAKFIRDRDEEKEIGEEDREIVRYEKFLLNIRKNNNLEYYNGENTKIHILSERFVISSSSLVFIIGSVYLGQMQYEGVKKAYWFIPSIAAFSSVCIFLYYSNTRRKLLNIRRGDQRFMIQRAMAELIDTILAGYRYIFKE